MHSKNGAKSAESARENPLAGRTILLVNTGSPKKRFIVQRLKKLGLTVVCLNKEKNWAQPYVDHWILADNTDHPEAILAVQKFMTRRPEVKIGGAVTFWEDDVLLTSKLIDKFDWIGIPYSVARRVRNKYKFRQFCGENGLPTPKFHIAKGAEDLEEVARTFHFPLVVKPAFGSSSAFVMKVNNKKEMMDSYRFAANAISPNVESALTDGLDLFCEEYLDGDEVDIDIILQNGKSKFVSIADNYNKDKGAFFQDSGQAIPSSLPVKAQKELVELAEEILERLGIQNGLIHFEGKYTSNGPVPIEINLRMGGDYVHSYTKSAWGIDLIEYAVHVALGDYIKIPPREVPKKYIIGWDVHPEDSGVLAELDLDDSLEKQKFVDEVHFDKEVGDPILVPPEGFENLGWLTVTGDNLLDAKDNLEKALKLINYRVVKFDEDSMMGKTERKDRFSSAVLNKNRLLRLAKIERIKKARLNDLKRLPLGLLCNQDTFAPDPVNSRIAETPAAIEAALRAKGYDPTVFNANDIPSVLDRLPKSKVGFVFNIGIGERLYHAPKYKPHIASLLELLQIPYSGSDPFTMFLAFDKIRFKKILAFHDIPTPRWDYLYDLKDELKDDLVYPLVVKPAAAVHAVGVTQGSVVENPKQLRQELEAIIVGMGVPALIEEYVPGDEYEAYILGNDEGNLQVLPLKRTRFDALPQKNRHVLSYESKFQTSGSNPLLVEIPPKGIPKKLLSLISEMALDTYSIFGCRDYGKVKIKADEDGNPYVIELNPNPVLHPNMGFATAAQLSGLDYGTFLEDILYLAVKRYKQSRPRY
jgi:D-alanine-D-alanine ligase